MAAGINYFFALLPDDRARSEIASVSERLRGAHRINGSATSIDDLCLMLCPMGKPERPQQSIEEALLAAAKEVSGTGFEVTLDSAMRFSASAGQYPFVLCADSASTAAALQLRKAIAAQQSRVGLPVQGVSSFLLHVRLLHGPSIEPVEESITPIQWQQQEFVLIRSFFGQSRHEVIGRWPLQSAPKPVVQDMLEEMANLPDLPDIPDLPEYPVER